MKTFDIYKSIKMLWNIFDFGHHKSMLRSSQWTSRSFLNTHLHFSIGPSWHFNYHIINILWVVSMQRYVVQWWNCVSILIGCNNNNNEINTIIQSTYNYTTSKVGFGLKHRIEQSTQTRIQFFSSVYEEEKKWSRNAWTFDLFLHNM